MGVAVGMSEAKARVLVIDDDLTVRELVTLVAEREGLEVRSADDGELGARMLRDERFDLIITDIMMPGMDGFAIVQLAQRIQPDARVIVASGLGEKVPAHLTETALRQLGVRRFIPKPFRASALRAAIKDALMV